MLGHLYPLQPTKVSINEPIVSITCSAEATVAISEHGNGFIWGNLGKFSSKSVVPISGAAILSRLKMTNSCLTRVFIVSDIGDCFSFPTKNSETDPNFENMVEFSGKVIVNVACGSSHAIFLSSSGEVFSQGSGEFGETVKILSLIVFTRCRVVIRVNTRKVLSKSKRCQKES